MLALILTSSCRSGYRVLHSTAVLCSVVPVYIEKFLLFRTLFWVSIRDHKEIAGSTAVLPRQCAAVLPRRPLELPRIHSCHAVPL